MENHLSKNLKYLRKKKAYTQQSLADACSDMMPIGCMSRTIVCSYEDMRAAPGAKRLIALSNVLGVSIDDLLKIDIEAQIKEKTQAIIDNYPLQEKEAYIRKELKLEETRETLLLLEVTLSRQLKQVSDMLAVLAGILS